MESSPNINHGIDPRDAPVLADIDKTLTEYQYVIDMNRTDDHIRTEEENNWHDLLIMVGGGLMTIDEAEDRHYQWLSSRGKSLI